MRVIVKKPGERPKRMEVKNSLESLQKLVGGYIETVTLNENDVIICNEDALSLSLPYNTSVITLGGVIEFHGTIVLAGIEGDGFTNAYHGLQSHGPLYCRTYLDKI